MFETILQGLTVAKSFQWVWDKFGKDIVQARSKPLWLEFQFNRAADRYAEDMKRQYGSIYILDMRAPVPLESLFTQVKLLTTPVAFRREKLEHLKHLEQIYIGKTTYNATVEKGIDALQLLKLHNHLFILGKPGAGKTTLLKYLVMMALNGEFGDRIPIFVSLRWFSESGLSLHEFIVKEFEVCEFPDTASFLETILRKGKALILFDGLDEVNIQDNVRDRIVSEVTTFSNTYDESQIVITSGVVASESQFEAFTTVEIADFEREQIEAFVTNWFNCSTSIDGIANRMLSSSSEYLEKQFLEEFDKPKHKRLYDLAKTPLILTLLCVAYEVTLEFPYRRSEIYEEAFNTLLRKWDSSRGIRRDTIYHKLTLGRKRQMFAKIAAETFEKNIYLLSKHQLAQKIENYLQYLPPIESHEEIDGEAVLEGIVTQHGIFTERARNVYSFSHLTFQEYFTARYIVEHAESGALKGLIQNHYTDNNWYEIFLLVAEMLTAADEFFKIFVPVQTNFI